MIRNTHGYSPVLIPSVNGGKFFVNVIKDKESPQALHYCREGVLFHFILSSVCLLALEIKGENWNTSECGCHRL